MAARQYVMAGRTFTKVSVTGGKCHAVEAGKFWTGRRSWEHRAVCGESISGTPVTIMRLTCAQCRDYLGSLR